MALKNEAKSLGFFGRIKKIFSPKTSELQPETKALAKTESTQNLLDEWKYHFDSLYLSEDLKKKAKSYEERQKFLARTDKENLEICQEKKQFINHKYDKAADYSFVGTCVALSLGGLCVWVGLSPWLWAVLAGMGASSKYAFDRLAYHAHLEEMEIERRSSLEECEDPLNKYAFLLVDAVKYINAQIGLWNLRRSYLNNELAEPTDQDRLRCKTLRAIRHDFDKSIKRLEHLYVLKHFEQTCSGEGVELERLHSGLKEHLGDLTPIVPEIATDPLMLEAIKDANAFFAENSEKELSEKIENLKAICGEPPATEEVPIAIEEDAENKAKLP